MYIRKLVFIHFWNFWVGGSSTYDTYLNICIKLHMLFKISEKWTMGWELMLIFVIEYVVSISFVYMFWKQIDHLPGLYTMISEKNAATDGFPRNYSKNPWRFFKIEIVKFINLSPKGVQIKFQYFWNQTRLSFFHLIKYINDLNVYEVDVLINLTILSIFKLKHILRSFFVNSKCFF